MLPARIGQKGDAMHKGTRSNHAPARTVVVDDHDVARLGLIAILESIPGVRVVAEASDGPGAVNAVQDHDADLVLMDVRMPDTEGLEAARQIRALRPGTRVVMVSYWDVPEYRVEAFEAGATGYISKGAPRAEFAHEIGRVLRDEPLKLALHTPPVAVADDPSSRSSVAAAAVVDRLAPRQREVLALIALACATARSASGWGSVPARCRRPLSGSCSIWKSRIGRTPR